MKRLQISIEHELDAALEKQAAAESTSKAALIRRFVRERLSPLQPLDSDPLWRTVGVDDYEPDDIDDVVYR